MSVIKEIEKIIEEAKSNGDYWEKNVPISMSRMNIKLNKIIDSYGMLPKEERVLFHNNISDDVAWSLLAFAENMATYSLRLAEQRFFTNGLSALGMILGILDMREILLIMPLYYDVSKRTKLSFDKVLNQNDDFAVFVKEFLIRDEESKSLKCMGYIFTNDENNNPIYQRTW